MGLQTKNTCQIFFCPLEIYRRNYFVGIFLSIIVAYAIIFFNFLEYTYWLILSVVLSVHHRRNYSIGNCGMCSRCFYNSLKNTDGLISFVSLLVIIKKIFLKIKFYRIIIKKIKQIKLYKTKICKNKIE